MLVIRFFRTGKSNQTSFKIVVTDKRKSSTRGRSVEQVGFYNPRTKEKILKQDRIKYWLSVGAKPSPTVHNLLISEKIIEGKKIDVHKKAKQKKGEQAPAEGVSSAEAVKPAEAPAATPVETPPAEEKKEEKLEEDKSSSPASPSKEDSEKEEPAKEPEKPAEEAPQATESQAAEEKKTETPSQ